MTVRGDTDTLSGEDYAALLDGQAEEYGEDDLDDGILDELVERPDDTGEGKRRPGTDTVLRRLEENDPEAADLLRGMQRRMSQSINAERSLNERLARLEGRLEGRGQGEDSEDAPEKPQLPEGITDENVRLFKQMADYLGYVPRDEVEQRDQRRDSETRTQQALREGVELYGEEFGTVNADGEVTLNPEIKARLQRRLQRMQDPRVGITPLELYQLEFGVGGGGRGTRNAEGEAGRRASARRSGRPNVTRRSTSRPNGVKIYDPKRGDSTDDVLDRAWAVGRRALTDG